MENFFRDLKPVDGQDSFLNTKNFKKVLGSWYLLMCKVMNPEEAIARGRYREVNLASASVIAGVLNALDTKDIPFLFGGNGVTLLFPETALKLVIAELERIKCFFWTKYSLELRMGYQNISSLENKWNLDFFVAKRAFSPVSFHAFFYGEGFKKFESEMMSNGTDLTHVSLVHSERLPHLKGLSCRWSRLNAVTGKIFTVVIVTKDVELSAATKMLASVEKDIEKVLKKRMVDCSPLSRLNLNFDSRQSFDFEKNSKKGGFSGFKLRVLHLTLDACFQTSLLKIVSPLDNYMDEMLVTHDHVKIDSSLKFTLDLDVESAEKIFDCLKEFESQGKVFFGSHVSDHSLMTCLTPNPLRGEHIHFIDGGDGGFAVALKTLKSKLTGSVSA